MHAPWFSGLYIGLLRDICNSIELPSLQAILGSMVGLLHEQFVQLILLQYIPYFMFQNWEATFKYFRDG